MQLDTNIYWVKHLLVSFNVSYDLSWRPCATLPFIIFLLLSLRTWEMMRILSHFRALTHTRVFLFVVEKIWTLPIFESFLFDSVQIGTCFDCCFWLVPLLVEKVRHSITKHIQAWLLTLLFRRFIISINRAVLHHCSISFGVSKSWMEISIAISS